MNITYSWDFPKFNVHTNLNGLNQVVYNVEWKLFATDGEGHGDYISGTVNIGEPNPNSFVPFQHLNLSLVAAWVESALGDQLADIKSVLENKIISYRAPATLSLARPW